MKRRRVKAVFLDKDDTIVEDIPYNTDPALVRFLPGSIEGVRALHAAGYLLFVVTNQPGVARGFSAIEDVAAMGDYMKITLAEHGAPLAGYYFCPHSPDGAVREYSFECACRKPRPGLILRAAAEHAVDLEASWFVGDILDDVEAGRRAGCRTVLIEGGTETEWLPGKFRVPHYIASDLSGAAAVIAAAGAR